MTTLVRFNGTFDDFDSLSRINRQNLLKVELSDVVSGCTKPLGHWLVQKKDVVVKGDNFVRNYHLLYVGRNKNGKFRIDYINE